MTAWESSEDPYRYHNVLFFEQPTSSQWVKTNGKKGKVVRVEQKPVDMLMELIRRYSKEGDVVADPFCGTGSTAVAAMMLGRQFIGGDVSNSLYSEQHFIIKQGTHIFVVFSLL